MQREASSNRDPMPLPFMPPTTRRHTPRTIRILSAVAAVLLLAGPVRAQEQGADDLIQVESVELEGVEAVDEAEVRGVMSTRASSWIPFVGETRYLDRSTFEADLDRILAFYRDHGFPDARVRTFSVDLSDDQRSVDITIVIDEGPALVVDRAGLTGVAVLPGGEAAALERDVAALAGSPINRPEVEATRTAVLRALRDSGYPLAMVTVDEASAGDQRVALEMTAEPGDAAVFGDIVIEGNASVGERVIRRALGFESGDQFTVSDLGRSQRRLYDLDLFQFVNLQARVEEMANGAVPVRLTVAEADHRRVRFSGGYGTQERLRGEASWRHVNFFGGARTLGFEGKWSSLDRGVRADFTQPYVLSPDLSFSAGAESWFANEPAYDLDTRGVRLAMTRQFVSADSSGAFTTTTTISGSVLHEADDFSISSDALADLEFRDTLIALGLDPRTGSGRVRLTALSLDLRRSTTANVINSRSGYVLVGHLEQAGGWLPGEANYVETTIEGRHYMAFGDRVVIANRLQVGSFVPPDPLGESVPFFKRYFLGGSNSLRGWGRFQVAPLTGSGLPIGGHSMLELSSELRLSAFGDLGLVAFVDGGNVWSDAWDLDLSSLRWNAGPGLRYLTPIGPVRVDLAFQLTPIDGLLVDGEPESRRWRVHFSIGQAF